MIDIHDAIHNDTRKAITFNLSHSGEYVLYAVANNRKVGVDIEYIRDFADSDNIAERFFSKSEMDEYYNLPFEARKRAFYSFWTRKEAFIKAVGEGLYIPLNSFSVSLGPERKSKIEIHKGNFKDQQWQLEQWSLKEIQLEDRNYVSAVAVKGKVNNISYWKWKQ